MTSKFDIAVAALAAVGVLALLVWMWSFAKQTASPYPDSVSVRVVESVNAVQLEVDRPVRITLSPINPETRDWSATDDVPTSYALHTTAPLLYE